MFFFLYHLASNRLYFFVYLPPKLIALASLLLLPSYDYPFFLPLL